MKLENIEHKLDKRIILKDKEYNSYFLIEVTLESVIELLDVDKFEEPVTILREPMYDDIFLYYIDADITSVKDRNHIIEFIKKIAESDEDSRLNDKITEAQNKISELTEELKTIAFGFERSMDNIEQNIIPVLRRQKSTSRDIMRYIERIEDGIQKEQELDEYEKKQEQKEQEQEKFIETYKIRSEEIVSEVISQFNPEDYVEIISNDVFCIKALDKSIFIGEGTFSIELEDKTMKIDGVILEFIYDMDFYDVINKLGVDIDNRYIFVDPTLIKIENSLTKLIANYIEDSYLNFVRNYKKSQMILQN